MHESQVCIVTFDFPFPPPSHQEKYGDISTRVLLRERLKCNSFDWYLKNIYPELHVPEDRPGWHGAVSATATLRYTSDPPSQIPMGLLFALLWSKDQRVL